MAIKIRKVKEEYGWLGNMSPYPVEHEGKQYRTSEALFQAYRFEDEAVRDEIRASKSPMNTKFISKRNREKMVIEPRSEEDLDLMRLCLRLKMEQHGHLREELLATGEQLIVEDVSKRRNKGSATFWGAALEEDGTWTGKNWLGKLWMELRSEIISSNI